jgi:hypothetical protein
MIINSRWAIAWFLLTAALALHIVEEAASGDYLRRAEALEAFRLVLPWLPIPRVDPGFWLINVFGAVVVLLSLTLAVVLGRKIMRHASYALAAFATANATLHIASSAASGEVGAGALTAPLMLGAALFLFVSIPFDGPERAKARRPATAS